MRKTAEAAEFEDGEVDPMKDRSRTGGLELGNQQEPADVEGDMDVDEDGGIGTSITGMLESASGLKPEAVPASDAPSPFGTASLSTGLRGKTS